eukprot:652028-Karenia_brevis.AAC.1
MCASVSSFQGHIEKHRTGIEDGTNFISIITADAPPSIDPKAFVSRSALVAKFAHAKPKALGVSGVGGELLRLFPRRFASLYHPLSTKTLIACTPPLQWVGGRACDLLKP